MGTSHSSLAQNPAMSLMGSVQSDESRPLPGAAVTVIHLPSGTRRATASDGYGRFVIPNLMAGGPYLIRVGEGGYRPQTVENIFLENGKTANFTVTLNKLGSAKDQNRANEPNGTTLTLANEAVVGGPVLMTISPKSSSASSASHTVHSAGAVPAPAATATAVHSSAPQPAPAPSMAPASSPPVAPPMASAARSASPATAAPVGSAPQAMTAAPAPAAAPTARYNRYSRYPARRPASTHVADPIVPGHYDAKSGNYIYETGAPTNLKLANGVAINSIGVNSTESYLYRFLSDPQMQVDSVDLTQGWYNFDKVFFESGKATLTTESLGQLRNIAAILRAYPKARIKLGGYTDNTGDYKVNRQLSEARARTAWASLVEMGVSPARLEARGYGSGYSISANETEEGRAKNRRLSVKVLQK